MLIRTASATCPGVAVVPDNTACSRSLLTKFMLSRSTCACSSGVSFGLAAMLPSAIALRRPTSNAPAVAVPTAEARFCVVPRSGPTSLAGDQRTLPDTENDQAEQHRPLVPVIADDEGQPHQRNGAEREAVAADLARRQTAVKPHDQHRGEEDREVERHHRDRGRNRRAALHDLDVQRDCEIEGGLERDDGEHRIYRGAFLDRLEDLKRKQRGLLTSHTSAKTNGLDTLIRSRYLRRRRFARW